MERLKNLDSHFTTAKEEVIEGKKEETNKLEYYRKMSDLNVEFCSDFIAMSEHKDLLKKFDTMIKDHKIFQRDTYEEDTRPV